MNREQFLALLARLRGEGDALTVDEFRALLAYVNENRGDADALTDDELVEVTDLSRALAEDDEATTDVLLAAADVVDAVATVQTERDEAEQAAQAERDEAVRRLRGETTDPTEGGDSEGGEGETETVEEVEETETVEETTEVDGESEGDGSNIEDREPVATAASTTPPARRASTPQRNRRVGGERTQRRTRQHAPIVRDGGGEYDGLADLGQAMIDRRLSMLSGRFNGSDKIVVGAIQAEYPADRVLDPMNAVQNMQRMEAVTAALHDARADDFDAVVAAGGLCAPLEPYYGIMRLGESDRPMRASFQQFNAGRGGIIFRDPTDFPTFADAVEIWTVANDADPGSDGPATKPCLVVPCPDTSEAVIYAVTECLEFGNFLARTDPETVRRATDDTLMAFARKAETKLIDLTKAASKAVTAGTALGAFRDLVYHMSVAAVGYRSRHRMRRDAVLEVRMPFWVYDMVRLDLMRSLPGDQNLAVADDVLNRALAAANLRVAALYLDSPTDGTSQVFGGQGTGQSLLDFPGDVQWQISSPGSFLLLDNGRLDVGVIRDSGLVETNDYRTFAESFEGLAFVGIESLWVTSTVCPNGASSGTVDPSEFCAGDYVPDA